MIDAQRHIFNEKDVYFYFSKLYALLCLFHVLFKLNRPFHGTWLTVPSVLAGALQASGSTVAIPISILLFALFAWLATCVGNFINDCYDVEIDRICRPKAPLAAGTISEERAWKMLMGEYVISIFILLATSIIAQSAIVLALGTISLICTYIYSAPPLRTKNRGMLGPITISIAYVAVVLGGWAIVSELSTEAVKFASFFGLLMLGIGFSKDFMHFEADKRFCNTPPVAYGVRATVSIASLCLIFPIVFVSYFIQLPGIVLSLFKIPLIFALISTFFMFTNPKAENRNIVMSAFLAYINSVFIIIFINFLNYNQIFVLLVILNSLFIIKAIVD